MRRVGFVLVRPQRSLHVFALVLMLLGVMVAPGVSAAPITPGPADYNLVTGAEAGVLAGSETIYVSPAEGVVQVRYYLDPSSRDLELSTVGGQPFAVVTEAPFALTGAAGFDAQALAQGSHTLVAAIDLADGGTVVKTARSRAANAPAATTATLAAAPAADCSPLACSQVKVTVPYTLTFSQSHGGLVDKNGVGTGFTWVDKPTAGGTGYIPANLEVDTAAGVLKITTTPGIAFQAENNQDNTLGVGIDAANQISILDTSLVNFPPVTGDFQQAGLWYGLNDDNYLKLAVVYELDGPRIQFVEERNGVMQQQVVTAPITVTGASVQLRLRATPATNTITAYYALNGAPLTQFKTFTVPAALFNGAGAVIDPQVGTAVFGGVFATDRFLQGNAVFQFDYFSLTGVTVAQNYRAFLPYIARSAQ